MEAASLCSSSPFFPSLRPRRMPSRPWHGKRSKDRLVCTARGDSRQWDYGEQLVNENMFVLRKRIHDTKMIERNYEPPSDWTEWDKQYYTCYNECICRIVGLLQSYLMNTKPSSAFGMLALLTMCFQASVVMVLVHLVQAANGVLSTINFH